MNRFYLEHYPEYGHYKIFDRQWNNSVPIAWCTDATIAEMIVTALNALVKEIQ